MFKKVLMLGVLVVLAVAAGTGWGDVPSIINIQAKITNGATAITSAVPGVINIYDTAGPTGGNLLATTPSTNSTTPDASGMVSFNFDLSSFPALNFSKQYYVTVNINKAGESARQQLTAAPYALTAKNVYGGTGYFAGNVGIGTPSPTASLEVAGTAKFNKGSYNTLISGGGNISTGQFNTAVGAQALNVATTSGYNTAVGYGALGSITTTAPGANTAVGVCAAGNVTTGNLNTCLGYNSMQGISTGQNNIAIGNSTMGSNTSGSYNIVIGSQAAWMNTGSGNVIIGAFADTPLVSSNNKLLISSTDGTYTYPLIFGDFAGKQVSIGTTTLTSSTLNVAGTVEMTSFKMTTGKSSGYILTCDTNGFGRWAASGASDARWKKNITPLKNSLEKVVQLQGVNYEWRTKEFPDKGFTEGLQAGLIAQDVEKVIPELVSTDKEGYKALAYEKLPAYLIEAVKELKAENEALKNKIEAIEKKLEKK